MGFAEYVVDCWVFDEGLREAVDAVSCALQFFNCSMCIHFLDQGAVKGFFFLPLLT